MPKSAPSPEPRGLLPSALQDLKAVVAAVITRDGELEEANAGFRRLVAGSDRDVRSLFLSPRFDQLAARRGDATDGAVYRGILTLGDDGAARSFTGGVYVTDGDELCLIAEPDVAELEASVASLQALNEQLAETLRVQALGVSAVARDLSESRRVERLLTKNTELMSAILASTTEAVVTIDRRGVIQSVNRATESMFGFRREELIGSNVSLLMPSPSSEEHDGYLARYRETGEERVIGSVRELMASRKDGAPFPIELAVTDVHDIGLFSGVIRDMSERTELQRHVLESATDEQRRIGQELHDVTGNELTGLSMLATALVESLGGAPMGDPGAQLVEGVDSPRISRISRMARQLADGLVVAHRHVRELSHGLVPAMIDPDDFGASLETLAAETDALDRVSCRLEYAERIDLPDAATGTHLYRIAQEAVSNALQHGRADRIWLSLSRQEGRILLEVSDDGVGFDPSSVRRSSGGMGLRTMHYRAGMLGASLEIETEEQGGTRIRCLLL
ncbi:MAG TPA: PAS domain S-box protein [Myxococcota bacterium]|nr:PAS domain S-box protein [Myxococcota bacterium]